MGGQTFDVSNFTDIKPLRDFLRSTKKDLTAEFTKSNGPITGVKEERDRQITVRDGEKIKIRTYTPEKAGGPLYVMIHGGGWCIGDLESEDLLSRLLCGKLGFVVVSVDYRLAPEHKFPTAHNDCWDALTWVSLWVLTISRNVFNSCRLRRTSRSLVQIRAKDSSSAAAQQAATSPQHYPT